MLTINDDRNVKTTRELYAKLDSSLPVLLDRNSEVVGAYRAYALPTRFLIDREQNIHEVWIGATDDLEQQLTDSINTLLKSHASPDPEKPDAQGLGPQESR